MNLKQELQLRTGFQTAAHEALLGIYHTASRLKKKAQVFFRRHGLTDVQFNVLALLEQQSGDAGGLTQIELSRMLLVNRANTSALIDRMEAADLVARTAVAGDRRCNLIRITASGRRRFLAADAEYAREVQRIMGALPPKRQQELVHILELVRRQLDGDPEA